MREQGFQVRALVRNPVRAATLAARGVVLVEGDLTDTRALQQLTADCAVVIHCAGAVRGNSQADFDRVNVAGTANLLTAINAQARRPRLLLLSSIAAREPQLSWYARSKREGEKLLEQFADLDRVVLRPPAVYGPGDKEMLPIFQWMHRGIALVPGSPEARTSLIHVSDLVGAIIACLQSEGANRQTFTLCDGKPDGYSWREIAGIAADYWSRPVHLWRVPRWLLDGIAALNSRTAGITGRAPMLTPPKLRELRHNDWVADNSAITAATGWAPKIGLRRGLELLNI
jgi:nucleoside-diphosphate-sugar epimerase